MSESDNYCGQLLTYKCVMLGSTGAGKSSIAQRYVRNYFDEHIPSTIGASFLVKLIYSANGKKKYKLDIWDTAGQERYDSLAPMYYRNAHLGVVVLDITNSDSLPKAQKWIKELIKNSPNCYIILLGNKLDREADRKISYEAAKEYADQAQIVYREVSAKTGDNIESTFEFILVELEKRHKIEDLITKSKSCVPKKSEQIEEKSLYESGKIYLTDTPKKIYNYMCCT